MKKVHGLLLFAGLIIVSLWSCHSDSYNECAFQPDISGAEINLEIEELHNKILGVQNKEELADLLQKYPLISEYFFQRDNFPNNSIMVDELFKWFTSPEMDTLGQEIEQVFGDLSQLKQELTTAFSYLKYYYPDVKLPKIQTVATGMIYDMYISDSLIVIGLDYYLGPGASFRPVNMHNYILKRYTPQYIVPSIMLLYGISPKYNKTDLADNTVLADMIAYGKSFYFAKQMMPCTPDSVMIWYSAEEISGARANAEIVWAHFVENQLFFETNYEVKRKYIEDRPKTYDIGDKAPGRIGTWLGWEIVKTYMDEQRGLALPALMETKDARLIFSTSKYRP